MDRCSCYVLPSRTLRALSCRDPHPLGHRYVADLHSRIGTERQLQTILSGKCGMKTVIASAPPRIRAASRRLRRGPSGPPGPALRCGKAPGIGQGREAAWPNAPHTALEGHPGRAAEIWLSPLSFPRTRAVRPVSGPATLSLLQALFLAGRRPAGMRVVRP